MQRSSLSAANAAAAAREYGDARFGAGASRARRSRLARRVLAALRAARAAWADEART